MLSLFARPSVTEAAGRHVALWPALAQALSELFKADYHSNKPFDALSKAVLWISSKRNVSHRALAFCGLSVIAVIRPLSMPATWIFCR